MILLSSGRKNASLQTRKRKLKLLQSQKNVIDLAEELPIFSAVSNADLENLNVSITRMDIKDLLTPFNTER